MAGGLGGILKLEDTSTLRFATLSLERLALRWRTSMRSWRRWRTTTARSRRTTAKRTRTGSGSLRESERGEATKIARRGSPNASWFKVKASGATEKMQNVCESTQLSASEVSRNANGQAWRHPFLDVQNFRWFKNWVFGSLAVCFVLCGAIRGGSVGLPPRKGQSRITSTVGPMMTDNGSAGER